MSMAFVSYGQTEEENRDVNAEIESITRDLAEKEKPIMKFKPIPVERGDGFYATVDYTYSTEDKDIKLEDNPALSSKDILEIKKVYSKYNDNRPEISIVLTNDGAGKFHLLTKENIGKPIAIVIAKQIVSMPIVNAEIMGGKVSISGDFSEKEIDRMIDVLQEGQ